MTAPPRTTPLRPDPPPPPRRQEERSATTRSALLRATVQCLVDLGYAGTTSGAIAERAGVSRGAQLHHFGTRERLVAAAISHLAERRTAVTADWDRTLAGQPDPVRRALDLMSGLLEGPLYAATLELLVAARTDPTLREVILPVEAQVNALLFDLCRQYVTADPVLGQMTLDLLAGRGVGGLLHEQPPRYRRRVLDTWAAVLAASAASPAPPAPPPPQPPPAAPAPAPTEH